MNRIHLSLATSLSFALALGTVACELDKEGEDTGAVDEDIEDDEEDDEGDDTGEDDTATTAGTGEDDGDDTGDDDGEMSTSAGGGDDDSDGDDTAGTGEDDSDSDDTGSDEGEMSAFAIAHGDLPEIDDGGGDSGGSTAGGGEDDIPADALHVTISGSGAKSCEMPYEGEPCGGNWSVSFTLLPQMQTPGSYNLFEEANGFQEYADEPHPEGDCAWGGGSLDGVLVIEAITDEAVVGHIEGSDAFDFDADLDFYADLCG